VASLCPSANLNRGMTISATSHERHLSTIVEIDSQVAPQIFQPPSATKTENVTRENGFGRVDTNDLNPACKGRHLASCGN
jgi:hypothetical protein